MKKTSQDFNIDSKYFVVELLEGEPGEELNYSNLVTVTVHTGEGAQQLQFNTHDKIEDATKQYNTIVATMKQLNACMTKPLYELKVVRTHNCYWMWD